MGAARKQKARLRNKELIRALEDVGEELTGICGNINYGGCCVMAAIMGSALEQVGYRVEIVTRAYWLDGIPKKVRQALEDIDRDAYDYEVDAWTGNGLNTGHLALRVHLGNRIITWDSDGVGSKAQLGNSYGGDTYYPFGQGLTVEEAMLLAETPKGWNSAFEREYIPELEGAVESWAWDTFGELVPRNPLSDRPCYEENFL